MKPHGWGTIRWLNSGPTSNDVGPDLRQRTNGRVAALKQRYVTAVSDDVTAVNRDVHQRGFERRQLLTLAA